VNRCLMSFSHGPPDALRLFVTGFYLPVTSVLDFRVFRHRDDQYKPRDRLFTPVSKWTPCGYGRERSAIFQKPKREQR
jgi:hypothetical protein